MKDNEDVIIKRENDKRKNGFSPGVIGFCVIVLILVMALGAVISALSGEKLTDIGKDHSGIVVYDSLPDSIRNIDGFSSGVVMLTDTAVDYLDSDGRRIASNSHLYSQPVMLNNGSTVFVYDKGGSAYRIEKKTSVYNNYDVNGTILTATLGKKGNYAYVLNENSGYQSRLVVYSSRGNKLFEWGSKSDYCVSLALSDNGNSVAIALVGVENGVYLSKVHFFNFNSDEAKYTAVFEDCTVFDIEYLNNKEIIVWTDTGIIKIDKNGNTSMISEYQSSELRYSSAAAGGLKLLSLARHGNDNNSKLVVFNKKYKELYSAEFSAVVSGVVAAKKYFAVVFEDSVKIFDSKNNLISTCIIGERCVDIAISGSDIYVHTVSGVYVMNIGVDYDLPVLRAQQETEDSGFSENVTFDEETTAPSQEQENVTEGATEGAAEDVTEEATEDAVISYG